MRLLRSLVMFAIGLAFIVVMLGVYTRLTNAGLGCPDWPGCYGQLSVPKGLFIEPQKAWTEMIHRYVAGILVLVVAGCLGMSLWLRRQGTCVGLGWPIVLCVWIMCQALLGMWTVTWRLLPVVVMAHLVFGALLFSGLCAFRASLSTIYLPVFARTACWISVGLVLGQMLLGGWVSANYAGVSCLGFPTCNGAWLPLEGLKEGLHVFSPIGVNYQGGVLHNDARAAIQVVHRLGAIVVALYVMGLAFFMRWCQTALFWRRIALMLFVLLVVQVNLGILNVIYFLPLPIAVLHNLVAVLLLATCVVMACLNGRRGVKS